MLCAFKKVIKNLLCDWNEVKKSDANRIIVFIDDLDRCAPEATLRMLEALKIYLDLEHCVFVLGVDQERLKDCIKIHYKEDNFNESSYLDKIVQLPFHIPLISSSKMISYIDTLIDKDKDKALDRCRVLIAMLIDNNPRSVKRFINTLTLNNLLAKKFKIRAYEPEVMALMLLIQQNAHHLYEELKESPTLLKDIQDNKEEWQKDNWKYLNDALKMTKLPESIEDLVNYIFLTEGNVEKAYEYKVKEINEILQQHLLWVNSNKTQGRQMVLEYHDLSECSLRGTNLKNAKLKGVDLSGVDLTSAKLSGADLTGARFELARLHDVNFSQANIDKAELSLAKGLTKGQVLSVNSRKDARLPKHLKNLEVNS